jgi:hypothetical protein
MANYAKRDARRLWVEQMASNRKPPADTSLRCHCGEPAVIGLYPEDGRNQFFCEAHKAESDALFRSSARR